MTNLDSGSPLAAAGSSGRSYTCSWCGTASDGSALSCQACGAAVNVKSVVSRSGWAELPGRRDMAKLQFGNSFCQIEGTYVPVADMNLAADDWVYFSHHVLLWMDTQVKVSAMSLKGAWKRMLAGMPLIMTQAVGPGRIAFSRDAPGEMIALPLQPGQAVDVREHLFMTATGNVTYDWFNTNVWFSTQVNNETETHYPIGMFMDRFAAPQSPGLLLLHASGNVFVRELAPNQTILIKPSALIFKDPTVDMNLHIENVQAAVSFWSTGNNRHTWLRLSGPGRVAVQSVFEKVEGEGRRFNNSSYATQRNW